MKHFITGFIIGLVIITPFGYKLIKDTKELREEQPQATVEKRTDNIEFSMAIPKCENQTHTFISFEQGTMSASSSQKICKDPSRCLKFEDECEGKETQLFAD
jgi:hypothetical protein